MNIDVPTVLFVFGCGAQGRVICDILKAQYPLSNLYFVDDNPLYLGSFINETEVIDTDTMFIMEENPLVHIALGNPNTRERLWAKLEQGGARFISAIHPSAVVTLTATIGQGCMIGAGAIVNTNAATGRGCIINTGAIIEHDTMLSDFSCVSPAATIGGRVYIGTKAFIASAAVVLARVRIGDRAVVGMGAVVLKDVADDTICYGMPATEKGKVDAGFDWNRLF
jgi:sugar O-acyltransferase (sialic acid O-acetyltransferase NeuD family)